MKLSNAQLTMLQDAATKERRDMMHRTYENGWFIPFRYAEAEVTGTQSTGKALCGKGLLEYKVYLEEAGRYPAVLKFRITKAGRQYLAECVSS